MGINNKEQMNQVLNDTELITEVLENSEVAKMPSKRLAAGLMFVTATACAIGADKLDAEMLEGDLVQAFRSCLRIAIEARRVQEEHS